MIPHIVDWRITANCNEKCHYCYACSDTMINFDINNDNTIIEKISQIGCNTVCVTGGEPLIDENGERAYHIISKLTEKNINVFLSTNGTNFLELEKKYGLGKYLAKLSMPLDGFDLSSCQCNGRNAESFSNVIKILEHYTSIINDERSRTTVPFIKISTVLTKKNVGDTQYWENLYGLINRFSVVKLWKIYDFVSENRGADNFEELSYEENELIQFIYNINQLKKSTSSTCAIEVVKKTTRDNVYFIIRPDGTVMTPIDHPSGTEEYVFGNIIDNDIEWLLGLWSAKVNVSSSPVYLLSRCENKTDGYLGHAREIASLEKIKKANSSSLFLTKIFDDDPSLKDLFKGETPIVKEILPVTNVAAFGLRVFLVNLIFRKNISQNDNKKIQDYLLNNNAVAWCAQYHILGGDTIIYRISIFAPNLDTCGNYVKSMREEFGEIIKSKEIDYVWELSIGYQSTSGASLMDTKITYQSKPDLSIKKEEKQVLLCMGNFSKTNKLTADTLLSTLKTMYPTWRRKNLGDLESTIESLRKKQIIQKFLVVENDKILGNHTFIISYKLQLRNNQKMDDLLEQFESYAHKIGATNVNKLITGKWDLDVEIKVPTNREMLSFTVKMEQMFNSSIMCYETMELLDEYKFTFLIPIVLEAIKTM